jgi:shikimate kinase
MQRRPKPYLVISSRGCTPLCLPCRATHAGWGHFRELEYATLCKAAAMPEWALVDAGGGCVVDLAPDGSGEEVLSSRKVIAMRRHALVIYIKRDVRYLSHRIAKRAAAAAAAAPPPAAGAAPVGDKNRPALSATSDFATIMARRAPWYEAAAHVVIEGCERDGSPRPKEALTAEVLRAFWARAEGGGRRGGAKGELREQLAKAAGGIASLGQFLLG